MTGLDDGLSGFDIEGRDPFDEERGAKPVFYSQR